MKIMTCFLAVALTVAGCGGGAGKGKGAQQAAAYFGQFKIMVQATGNIQPLDAVQILPPVAGRIDKILVEEGATVKRGQTLAWMSSADRAVLLDNARAKGEEEVKYWEDTYKPTPIIAPADGMIISRNVVEGQTVSAGTNLYDLSNRLIVRAAVDETDLGKIHGDQRAEVTVDAYPDKMFSARVRLISHQSTKVNNVVTYFVELNPEDVPGTLRAGMTANVNFIVMEKSRVLMLPSWAVKGAEKTRISATVVSKKDKKSQKREIFLGASDGTQVEVLKGINEGDAVMVEGLKLAGAASGGIFGMPQRGGRQGAGGARPGGAGAGGNSKGGAGR